MTAGSRKKPLSWPPVPPPVSTSPPDVLDLLEQLVAARARVDRAHPQPRLLGLDRAVAGLVALDALDELRDEVVVDGVVHEHALAAQARLPGVPVAADDHRLDGGLDVGVLAHDHRVGAAELERDALEQRPGAPPPRAGRPRSSR